VKTVLKSAVAALALLAILLSVSINASAQTAMPDACKSEMSASGDMSMPEMQMGQMAEHHKAMMEAMQQMHPAMMQGMMAKDPDVSFICGMIAHHMGAISMSEVELNMVMTNRQRPWLRRSSTRRKKRSRR
jgi:uncharacterized protein (DUF305 family)